MLILNGHLMEIANATLTATPGLAATMTAMEPGTQLVDANGDLLIASNGDVIGICEHGVSKISATLSEIILSRGV